MAQQERVPYQPGQQPAGSAPTTAKMAPGGSRRRGIFGGGMRIGSIFGIEINLHVTVLIIFALILFSLGSATFPSLHPEWSPALHWGLALLTAVLFFVSLLAHELAHSVVAQWRGMEINRITLFLFGGVSELKSQPPTAGTEFLVAIAGPLMSVLIGVLSWVIAGLMVPPGFMENVENAEQALSGVGPVPTMLLWLGFVNLFLAAFNMVPGFPLDGGRVLRSIFWGVTGDLRKATLWAANSGKVVAFVLMGLGVLEMLMGGFINGLWLLFISWFLYGAARNAYSETVLRQQMRGFTVGDLMDTSFDVADADMDVAAFAANKLAHHGQPLWPVLQDGQVIGTVSVQQVSELPAEARGSTKVAQITQPLAEDQVVDPNLPGQKALEKLAESPTGVLLAMREGRVAGLLTQYDVTRWLALFARDAESA